VKISRPLLTKRLEKAESKAPAGGQNNPSSSPSGNPVPKIIMGCVLWVNHISIFKYNFHATFTYIFQKEFYLLVESNEFVFLFPNVENKEGITKSIVWENHFIT
jgi:hypothetical protein